MMKSLGSLKLHRIFLAAALLLVCQPAFAGKRVALVLGNSVYQNAPPLPNPVNDAAVIAAKLKEAGFDVVDSRRDLPAAETRRALRDFADAARDADIAVVYYAGHGLEVDGTNYLVPVDAKLERDTDVYDEALSLDRVLVAVEPAKQLRLVILDACRDNPFAKTMKRSVASRSIERGLAKIEPSSPNTLIAYSAKAGSTALDGDAKNSPFTLALANHLTTPGLDVRKAFGFVRDDVLKTTGNRQEPFVYGSLGGNDVPLVPARLAPAAAAPNPQAEARADYELALQIGNKDAFGAFLAQHPDGFYASLAKIQLAKIAAEEARVAATEKARQAEQERARLAAEGAQKAQQAKADSDAKAAEQARLAAEKAKEAAQAQATEAERKRVATDTPSTRGTPDNNVPDNKGARKQYSRQQSGWGPDKPCLPERRAAAGRVDQIGAGRVAPRRLSHRRRRWRMERGVATFAGTVQQERRNQIRRQAGESRRARCHQAEAFAGLPADLRARLQGRRRPVQQDRLRGRLGSQRRQRVREAAGENADGKARARPASRSRGPGPAQTGPAASLRPDHLRRPFVPSGRARMSPRVQIEPGRRRPSRRRQQRPGL